MARIDTAQPTAPGAVNAPGLVSEGMDRGVGQWSLFWSSEGSIIGSGWLFGALDAGAIAGPSAIVGWVIASAIVLLLALVHAELGGFFPVSGGTSRFPHYAFGSFAGATFGWFSYVQAAATAPIEVLAAIEYFSRISWASGIYNGATSTLSPSGIVVAVALMFVFTAINLVGVRWLARVNNTLTSWKVIVPVLTIIVLPLVKLHPGNFTAGGGFFVHGAAVKSILVAIPSGGIVFSLLGFEQAVQLAGEARRPRTDIPRAVITSVLVGGLIYLLLQVVFVLALDPRMLATAGGWTGLSPVSTHNTALVALNKAPFFQVVGVAGIAWLALILRVDAAISPSGTGLVYLASSARILFSLSRNGYVPVAFERTTAARKVPLLAVLVSTVIGLVFLLPFPSWSKLVNIATSSAVLMYAGAPLAFGALRLQKPNIKRPYRMPGGEFWAPVSFILANFIVYWSGWSTYSTLLFVGLLGYVIMGLSAVLRLNPHRPKLDTAAIPWVLSYIFGMGVISYLGGFGEGGILGGVGVFKDVLVGGRGALGLYWDLIVLTAFSLIIYYWAVGSRLSEAEVDHYVANILPTQLTGEWGGDEADVAPTRQDATHAEPAAGAPV